MHFTKRETETTEGSLRPETLLPNAFHARVDLVTNEIAPEYAWVLLESLTHSLIYLRFTKD